MSKKIELLSSNFKLAKTPLGTSKKYLIAGLALAPASNSGYNVCPWSTPKCRQACVLWFAGRTVMAPVREAALRRTRMFFEEREAFLTQLKHEIRLLVKRAAKADAQPVVRLNVGSDISWESVCPEVFSENPDVVFYDYTKGYKRALASLINSEWPSRYYLTYSMSEAEGSDTYAWYILQAGGRVAAVVAPDFERKRYRYSPMRGWKDPLPTRLLFSIEKNQYEHKEWRAVDADEHDLRLPEMGESGVLCLLRLKATGNSQETKAITSSGFTRQINPAGTRLLTNAESQLFTPLTLKGSNV
jgi:hypothetical protein